ncbi:MAG: alpha-L-rhamnosidase C-terminal domain-containing protein [Spirochaetia bacterium]
MEVPTDCPQRDERLGWTGDAQVFMPTAAFNMDVASFFTKWQRDLEDSQGADGTIPSFAPVVRYESRADARDGGPAWSDAVVICPWTIFKRYGDIRILERHYESMKSWLQSLSDQGSGLIRSDESFVGWGGYGDWVSMDAPEGSTVGATPKDLIGTAYFARVSGLMEQIARLLSHDQDEVRFKELRRRVVMAFRDEYVTPRGRLLGDTQTAYVVALAFDLLPPDLRQTALDRLVSDIERRGNRLSTGFVGTPLLCPVLTRFGRVDIAYKLLLHQEYPSWLYTVQQGATTMWERWNSYTIENGFGPVEMNSFNHYAYGAIGEWMYATVSGLSVDFSSETGSPIEIAPQPGYGLTRASAELLTPYGFARSSWQLHEGTVTLSIVVPANTSANLSVPSGGAEIEIDTAELTSGDSVPVDQLVVRVGTTNGSHEFRVAAGRYTFRWAL